jgi:uncharacterized membrane protein
MKTRGEIKAQAMRGFTSRYWPVVGISLLGTVIVFAMAAIPGIGWLVEILVGIIIMVGLYGFFVNVYRGDPIKVENLFTPFNRYGRVLGGSLWKKLWLFLWSLIFMIPYFIIIFGVIAFVAFSAGTSALTQMIPGISNGIFGGMPFAANYLNGMNNFWQFFSPWLLLVFLLLIPAIIKSFSYFCTEYILADSPNVGAIEALTISKKLMIGYKWKLFVLGLTFIGWAILSVLTAGILYIFFTGPYMSATFAGFYEEVKQQGKQKGIEGAELL